MKTRVGAIAAMDEQPSTREALIKIHARLVEDLSNRTRASRLNVDSVETIATLAKTAERLTRVENLLYEEGDRP